MDASIPIVTPGEHEASPPHRRSRRDERGRVLHANQPSAGRGDLRRKRGAIAAVRQHDGEAGTIRNVVRPVSCAPEHRQAGQRLHCRFVQRAVYRKARRQQRVDDNLALAAAARDGQDTFQWCGFYHSLPIPPRAPKNPAGQLRPLIMALSMSSGVAIPASTMACASRRAAPKMRFSRKP